MQLDIFLPPGMYHTIDAPRISRSDLIQSWLLDQGNETLDGVSARDCGISAIATPASPRHLREAVECIAYYFKREFDYSFIQYCSRELDDDQHRAYLWTDPTSVQDDAEPVIGACCFRWRQWKDAPPDMDTESYALQWVWIHPYERRKGLLSKAWPYLQKRFGKSHPRTTPKPRNGVFFKKASTLPI